MTRINLKELAIWTTFVVVAFFALSDIAQANVGVPITCPTNNCGCENECVVRETCCPKTCCVDNCCTPKCCKKRGIIGEVVYGVLAAPAMLWDAL